MNKTDALDILRLSVADFDRGRKMELATLLVTQCIPHSEVTWDPPFEAKIDSVLATVGFTRQQKLVFAIELLQYELSESEDEEDGLPTADDYENNCSDPDGYFIAINEGD